MLGPQGYFCTAHKSCHDHPEIASPSYSAKFLFGGHQHEQFGSCVSSSVGGVWGRLPADPSPPISAVISFCGQKNCSEVRDDFLKLHPYILSVRCDHTVFLNHLLSSLHSAAWKVAMKMGHLESCRDGGATKQRDPGALTPWSHHISPEMLMPILVGERERSFCIVHATLILDFCPINKIR